MEGDIKDIVLTRLEKRLKDKDEEIRSLKERLEASEDTDRIKALEARVEHLEQELHEAQTTLSEVLKKFSALEAAVIAANCAEDGGDELADPDLALDGQSQPLAPERYDTGVAADRGPGDGEKKDAMRFFHMGKNA